MKNHIDQSHLEALKKVADQRNIETETSVPPLAFTETERVSNKVVRYRRLSQAETESDTENKQGVRNEHRGNGTIFISSRSDCFQSTIYRYPVWMERTVTRI